MFALSPTPTGWVLTVTSPDQLSDGLQISLIRMDSAMFWLLWAYGNGLTEASASTITMTINQLTSMSNR
jgi:hypothetical protein